MAKNQCLSCQFSSAAHHFLPNRVAHVKQLRTQIQNKTLSNVESKPGVYRWWFPEDEWDIIRNVFDDPSLIDDSKLLKDTINDVKYVALYIGKSKKLKRRIKQHVEGPDRHSTLRRSIKATLRPNSNGKNAIDHCLDKCYWEWCHCSNYNKVEREELYQQNISYPLNIKDNRTVSPKWIANLKQLRKKSSHVKSSSKCKTANNRQNIPNGSAH